MDSRSHFDFHNSSKELNVEDIQSPQFNRSKQISSETDESDKQAIQG